jgi:hypothetical protein
MTTLPPNASSPLTIRVNGQPMLAQPARFVWDAPAGTSRRTVHLAFDHDLNQEEFAQWDRLCGETVSINLPHPETSQPFTSKDALIEQVRGRFEYQQGIFRDSNIVIQVAVPKP